MTKDEIAEILRILELDYEAEPTLIYLFYVLPDGRVNNFSISVRRGKSMSNKELEKLMRREYPSTREGTVVRVERPKWQPPVDWMDSSEVCRLLNISRKTLWKWTKRELFSPSRIEGRLYYNRQDIDRVIASHAIDENGRLDTTANG